MTFESIADMLRELRQYRVYHNRYMELEHEMKGVKSPRLSDEPTGSPVSKETRYIKNTNRTLIVVHRVTGKKILLEW